MIAIVAADKNWGIGRGGALLLRVPADMKRFRAITTGKTIVLGRKTLITFPQGKPLPDRLNIVLSRNPSYRVKDAVTAGSAEHLRAYLEEHRIPDDETYVIGGEQVYQLLMPYCDTCLVTRFDRAFDADAFFPDLDADDAWELTESSEEQVYFDTTYTFCTYKRKT